MLKRCLMASFTLRKTAFYCIVHYWRVTKQIIIQEAALQLIVTERIHDIIINLPMYLLCVYKIKHVLGKPDRSPPVPSRVAEDRNPSLYTYSFKTYTIYSFISSRNNNSSDTDLPSRTSIENEMYYVVKLQSSSEWPNGQPTGRHGNRSILWRRVKAREEHLPEPGATS